ncbi:MAG: hypothetical protein ACOY3I_03870 [Verrucomicrobiota bacterium]
MIHKPFFLLWIGFFICAILILTVGIFGAHHIYEQSEVFRRAAVDLSQYTPEQASRQLIQYAFEAEISCKNVAAAALLAFLMVLLMGGFFARKITADVKKDFLDATFHRNSTVR